MVTKFLCAADVCDPILIVSVPSLERIQNGSDIFMVISRSYFNYYIHEEHNFSTWPGPATYFFYIFIVSTKCIIDQYHENTSGEYFFPSFKRIFFYQRNEVHILIALPFLSSVPNRGVPWSHPASFITTPAVSVHIGTLPIHCFLVRSSLLRLVNYI